MPPYLCHRSPEPLEIDPTLTHPVWLRAPRSPRFADMVTGEPGYWDTRAAAVWDDRCLHVAFWIDQPFPEAHLTTRDSLIFTENDVELFLDGGDCYYELEINALGTVYEVFFIWQDVYPRFAHWPEFDLRARRALTFGGDYDRHAATFWRGTHPRGLRWAFLDWDLPGLETAVHVDGVLNDRATVSGGWTAHLALPWAGMTHLAGNRSLPPRDGDSWRMFFGRFEKLTFGGRELQPHPAWVWSPHGVYDTHQPDLWTEIRFSASTL